MSHAGEDAEAVRAAQDGDTEAFGSLVERYQEPVFRAAWVILRDAAAAEDVAQEAFVRAYNALGGFEPGQPFRPWVLRIATNLAINETRRRKRSAGLVERFARLVRRETPGPAAEAEANERRDLLLGALHELREEDRLVLYLRYYLELSLGEVATVLECPTGTVKSRLHRAGGRLREVIEARYPSLRREYAGRSPSDD